jgi:dihydroorotate dehydrogenase electron transfer subunit
LSEPLAAGTEPRTLAPPERRVAVVSGVERLGAYHLITAHDACGPTDPQPGQFYMLAADDCWGGAADERPYLPRAFSYARAHVEPDGVSLGFLLEAIGPGTELLAELAADDGLALVGPLGVGFRPAPDGMRPILVGGGIGAAPLLCLHEDLDEAAVLLGFRSAAHAQAAALFSGDPQVVTDDGSVGRQALVSELLAVELDADPRAAVFACGPPAMLEAVRAMCAERGVPAQLALESGMACGFGACFGCVVETHEGYVRLCVDGPVLDADSLETALIAEAGH